MIILDTNVVSEPMKLKADLAVQAWLDRQSADTLYLTSISLAELLLGIEVLLHGKRR
jgi:predicted nucleic acid-binding protein